jgi:hypothetical protein
VPPAAAGSATWACSGHAGARGAIAGNERVATADLASAPRVARVSHAARCSRGAHSGDMVRDRGQQRREPGGSLSISASSVLVAEASATPLRCLRTTVFRSC